MGFLTEHIKKNENTFVSSCWKALFPTETKWLATESMVAENLKKINWIERKINSDVADNEIEKITICQNLREISSSSLCRWLLY